MRHAPLPCEDNLRPVIYYLKHLLQDMDETKMLSRALISYIRFDHPQTIMHPILAFSLDLLWDKLVPWAKCGGGAFVCV